MRFVLALTLLLALPLHAADDEPGIQDNSLLTEEAYNQDPGVVQHINLFIRDRRTHDWLYTFTQEWPAPGLTHQLSYTLPLPNGRVGHVALNYRYQLAGNSDAKYAATPRVTITLPTGDWRRGDGNGAVGVQLEMAQSVAWSERWNEHFDAGVDFTPRARASTGARHDVRGFNLGHNVVWLPAKRVNFMVETVFAREQSENSFVVSPAIRWSYNFPSGLQIVPAIGVPIGVGPSAGERSVILYLSFEHPFRRVR